MKRKMLMSGMAAVVLLLAGCGNGREGISEDLMRGRTPGETAGLEEQESSGSQKNPEGQKSGDYAYTGDGAGAVTDFAVRMLRQTMEEEHSMEERRSMEEGHSREGNILLSPLSVVSALTMTANGARGETLAEMEETFSIAVPELSQWLRAYQKSLPAGEKYKLSMANSIWFTEDERFTVEQDFLQMNADYFNAGAYRAPFDDSTVADINRWVDKNTDGMIQEILSQVSPSAVMYLVNALVFDAQWQQIYREDFVREGEFTGEDGTVWKTEMMYSEENFYLTDGVAEGFLKYYADAEYAFAALLPREGATLSEYISSLTGEGLRKMLCSPQECHVNVSIPKFEMEYDVEMSDILKKMGMSQAFDETQADLSGIGSSTAGNLYISKVLHKTYMAVDERGTRAGAATAVEAEDGCAMILDMKTVHLDRPFLCMIIDCEERVPVFIGVVEKVTEIKP